MHCTVNVNEQECEKQSGRKKGRDISEIQKVKTLSSQVPFGQADNQVFARGNRRRRTGREGEIEGTGRMCNGETQYLSVCLKWLRPQCIKAVVGNRWVIIHDPPRRNSRLLNEKE